MNLFGKKGISLLEAVLTIFVLAVGFMSSMQAIQEILTTTNFSDKEVVATQLASEKLEGILADRQAYGFTYIIGANYPDEVLTGDYVGYERRTYVFPVTAANLNGSAAPPTDFKRVEVHVKHGNAIDDKIELTGLVGAY
ncbi:MAG: hypothetical protein ABII18_07750 [bacterium]|nr:hypothetical protein [bacterium]MBU1918439.1 hypothetical protein [bacterium]